MLALSFLRITARRDVTQWSATFISPRLLDQEGLDPLSSGWSHRR